MDPKEEQIQLKLYSEVSSGEYRVIEYTALERSDPFEDRRGEFNISDSPHQPRYSSSEKDNSERKVIEVESNHEYVDITENGTNEN